MPDARFDESAFAQAAADALGTRHTTLDCATSPAQDLVHLIHQIGLPFGDSSLLPSYWLCRAAREHVTVALSGDGGDEFFLGYDRYVATRFLTPSIKVVGRLSNPLARTPDPKSRRARAARLLDAAQGQGYFDLLSIFPSSMLRPLVTPSDFDRAMSSLEGVRIRTPGVAAAHDAHFYLPYDLMRKSDSASMSVALEVRSPFLDPLLAGTALSSRVESLMPAGERKGLLRAVARKYLPPEIVDRPKQGFAIPIGEWFRTDYGGMKQLLMDHLNSAEPWGPPSLGIDLNMKFVRRMIDEHMGTGPSGRIVRDHSQRLYMLLVLSIWAKWVGSL
jgi:asparagine synthase (glutamine-hydrolysing)